MHYLSQRCLHNARMNRRNAYQAEHPRQIIRRLLTARGFHSPRALAIHAGVSQPTLSRYLAGRTDDMEMATWRSLSMALEVTLSQLLGETPLSPDASSTSILRAMEKLSDPERAALVAAANAMAESHRNDTALAT